MEGVRVDLATVVALRSPRGQELLAALPDYDPSTSLALGARLRRSYEPALVAAALTQSRLRASAARRLGPLAHQLLWTPDSAEQATRTSVAVWRAERLAAAGATAILDLGAGAGGDALAFAGAGLRVVAVERDPVTAAVLRHNAEVADGEEIRVVETDAANALPLMAGCDAVFADPARRAGGRRVLDPAGWSPPLSLIAEFAARVPFAAAKVGPGIAHELVPTGAQAEWVSDAGDVLECALWWGGARDGEGLDRAATLLGPPPRTLVGKGGQAVVRAPGTYLHEPDGAVIRAGLVADVAAALRGGLLDATIAYVTTDEPRISPFTTRYAIAEVLPFSVKGLRARLRELDVGRVAIKKRGTAVTPEALRPQLRLAGTQEATIVLTRIVGKPYALLVSPA
jgi:SAM-dependent methyltransferase